MMHLCCAHQAFGFVDLDRGFYKTCLTVYIELCQHQEQACGHPARLVWIAWQQIKQLCACSSSSSSRKRLWVGIRWVVLQTRVQEMHSSQPLPTETPIRIAAVHEACMCACHPCCCRR